MSRKEANSNRTQKYMARSNKRSGGNHGQHVKSHNQAINNNCEPLKPVVSNASLFFTMGRAIGLVRG